MSPLLPSPLVVLSLVSGIMSLGLLIALFITLKAVVRVFPRPDVLDRNRKLSVVIPARNESVDLELCVRSILAQRGVYLNVTIVNDHSTDGTREIADLLVAEDHRVQVIHDPPLKPGWLGKVNAMQHGIEATADEIIVLSDADIVHDPDCFAIAYDELQSSQIDLLSLGPQFENVSFWENVLMPHVMVAGVVQFFSQSVNDPQSKNAAAAGAFIMLRRSVLDAVGGLHQIRSEFLDDVAIARVCKRNGYQTRMWLTPDLLKVRLFKTNHHAFWGLTKNILGAVDHIWLAVPAMFLPIFVYWVPLVTFVLGLWRQDRLMIAAGGGAWLIQAAFLLQIRRICTFRWGMALAFPLGAIPAFCCFAKALYHRCLSGSVDWRGRVISVRPS